MPIDEKVKEKAGVAFTRARVSLLQRHPFWAHLVIKMPLEWMENVGGGLSMTDGKSMFINPEEFLKLTKEQQVTDLVHEAFHCAAGHLFRRGSRDAQKWNLAADVALDASLSADGFDMSGPWEQARAKGLAKMHVEVSAFAGLGVEAIYEKLPDSPKMPQGGCGGCGSPEQGGRCFTEAPSQAEKSALDAQWRQNVIEAGQLAGDAKGSWSELVKAAMPRVPFTLALWEFLQRGLGGDSDWAYLNRRHIHAGLYLPTDTRQVMGRVVWVTDTSGSMGQEELKLAFGMFRSFREEHPCEADLICCDYGVASHQTFDEWQPLPEEFEAAGRGGTSFNAPFRLLREKRIEPCVVIYATDGWGEVDAEWNPRVPVLWVLTRENDEFKPPFGKVVVARP